VKGETVSITTHPLGGGVASTVAGENGALPISSAGNITCSLSPKSGEKFVGLHGKSR
jgi:hypothetical protein